MSTVILVSKKENGLNNITKVMPKCMIKVNGRYIISYAIDAAIKVSKDVIVVAGHHYSVVKDYIRQSTSVKCIKDISWKLPGEVWPLVAAAPYINTKEDLYIINGNLMFEPRIIELMRKNQFSCITCDTNNKEGLPKIEMTSVFVREISMNPDKDTFGVPTGIYKITSGKTKEFLSVCFETYINKKDSKVYEVFNKFATITQIVPEPIGKYKYLDIKNIDDLKLSREMFKQ